MNDKLSQALAQIDGEINSLQAKLAELTLKRTWLDELQGKAPKVNAKGSKAPKGHLMASILKTLSKGKGMTNRRIRETLQGESYPYMLKEVQVAKALNRLVESKKAKKKPNGSAVEFWLP